MNPLLTDILTAAYGPMYIDNAPPTSGDDETGGYRAGSVAYDTLSERFYICKDATAGAADWVLIPADANYEYKSYAAPGEFISLSQNTSVFKAYNTNTLVNINCYVNLPANPYTGKVVILYFQDPTDDFSINDSDGNPISSGASLTIALGQQYTITYGGVAWEIVGVSNISPAAASGVSVTKGATVIPNTTAINFIGAAVTVAPSGSGANVTINPLSGVDVTRGATTVTAAQTITFTNSFLLTGGAGVANIAYVSKIQIEQDGAPLTNPASTISGFDFIGSMFSENPVVLNGNTAEITLNGAKTWLGGTNTTPGVNDDDVAGYSTGSIGYNNGGLLRTYACINNSTGAALWKRITEDNGYVVYTPTSGGTANPNFDIANIIFNIAGSPLSTYRVNVPANAYVGKKLYMTFQSNINQLFVRNSAGTIAFGPSINIVASAIDPKLVIFVCSNEGGTQTWVRVQ